MNKIVSEHVVASELPQHLRTGIDASSLVTVIVEEEPLHRKRPSAAELKAMVDESRAAAKGITTEEAVSRIRALRDEWDE